MRAGVNAILSQRFFQPLVINRLHGSNEWQAINTIVVVEYGIRLGLFAGIRQCSLRACFLALLFAVYRQIVLSIVNVAVRIAVQTC